MGKTSDELLSERIIAELKSKGLVSGAELEKLGRMYRTGKVSAEDWVLFVESSLKKEAKHDEEN